MCSSLRVSLWSEPLLYLAGGGISMSAPAQLYLLNSALASSTVTLAVPAYQSLIILLTIISGSVSKRTKVAYGYARMHTPSAKLHPQTPTRKHPRQATPFLSSAFPILHPHDPLAEPQNALSCSAWLVVFTSPTSLSFFALHSGGLFFQEFSNYTALSVLSFAIAICMIIAGLAVLSYQVHT